SLVCIASTSTSLGQPTVTLTDRGALTSIELTCRSVSRGLMMTSTASPGRYSLITAMLETIFASTMLVVTDALTVALDTTTCAIEPDAPCTGIEYLLTK